MAYLDPHVVYNNYPQPSQCIRFRFIGFMFNSSWMLSTIAIFYSLAIITSEQLDTQYATLAAKNRVWRHLLLTINQ